MLQRISQTRVRIFVTYREYRIEKLFKVEVKTVSK